MGRHTITSEDRIAFESMTVASRSEIFEHKVSRKIPVGSFGIIGSDGRPLTMTWVNSTLARKIKATAPSPQSHWAKYQLESMFAGWYPNEVAATEEQGQMETARAGTGDLQVGVESLGRLYSPDETIFVYATDLQEAQEAFEEEMEYLPASEDWKEYSLTTVAHATEMIGIGGYDTVEFEQIIRWNNITTPYVFTDIPGELARDWEDEADVV